jgi:hypothetical protein
MYKAATGAGEAMNLRCVNKHIVAVSVVLNVGVVATDVG